MYPIHVSGSFLLTRGLNSAVYLMLLRFLHRDYAEVFRLVDSIATDRKLNKDGIEMYENFGKANDDTYPDAHACRLKISLVTLESGMTLPWDLTYECARYIQKFESVSSACRLGLQEELQLLESSAVVLEPKPKVIPKAADSNAAQRPFKDARVEADYKNGGKWYPGKVSVDRGDGTYDIKYDDNDSEEKVPESRIRLIAGSTPPPQAQPEANANDDVSMALCFNRREQLRGIMLSDMTAEIACRGPPRAVSSNWSYYQDNTLFGEKYIGMKDITSAEDGENSWQYQVRSLKSLNTITKLLLCFMITGARWGRD